MVLKFIIDKIIIMNWGYKILLVYAVFVLGIMFLVYKSSRQKVDLVTTDYYAKELKYQDKIDAMNHADKLTEAVKYEIGNGKLTIVFPKDFSGKKVEGQIVMYCPANEDKDVKHNFSVEDQPVYVPIKPCDKGEYDLKLDWKADGTSYYFEKKLFIN